MEFRALAAMRDRGKSVSYIQHIARRMQYWQSDGSTSYLEIIFKTFQINYQKCSKRNCCCGDEKGQEKGNKSIYSLEWLVRIMIVRAKPFCRDSPLTRTHTRRYCSYERHHLTLILDNFRGKIPRNQITATTVYGHGARFDGSKYTYRISWGCYKWAQ